MTLASRILDALPPHLVSLEWLKWPAALQVAFHNVWRTRIRQMLHHNPSALLIEDDVNEYMDLIMSSSTDLSTQSCINMLHRLHLPHLRAFAYQSKSNMTWSKSIECRAPLTRLTLSDMEMSTYDAPLCDMFRALPRTLIDLELRRIDNDKHVLVHRNSFLFSFAHRAIATGVDHETRIVEALPPHLTRLVLRLTAPSYLPAVALKHLHQLTTLKLIAYDRNGPASSLVDITVSPHILSHLPQYVHTLSLSRFETTDLKECVSSIPETHDNLRHLKIKHCYSRYDGRHGHDFLHLIATHEPFVHLETLHVYESHFHHTERLGMTDVVTMNMPHLRSVSNIFQSAEFDAFWSHIAPTLSLERPMQICAHKTRFANITPKWVNALRNGNATTPLPLHFIIERFELRITTYRALLLLAAISTSNTSLTYSDAEMTDEKLLDTNNAWSPSFILSSPHVVNLLKSVKHLYFFHLRFRKLANF